MMQLVLATTLGRIPPVQATIREGEIVGSVNGAETDPIVAFTTRTHLVQASAVVALLVGSLSFWFGGVFVAIPAVGWGWWATLFIVNGMRASVLVLAPLLTIQDRRLRHLGTFRKQHNLLRSTVSRLSTENTRLSQSISILKEQNTKLDTVLEELRLATQQSGLQSVDQLVQCVHENGRLQKRILKNLQAQVLQQIISSILQTDRDRNFILTETEVNALLLRLQHLPGVQVDAAAFNAMIQNFNNSNNGGDQQFTLANVCALLRILDDQVEEQAAYSELSKFHAKVKESLRAKLSSPFHKKKQTQQQQQQYHVFQFRPKDLLTAQRR